jgi:hypothetical protein
VKGGCFTFPLYFQPMKLSRLCWIVLVPFIAACTGDGRDSRTSQPPAEPKGKQLLTQYCGACHALPTPTDLDQKTWKNHILIRMGAYMGIYNDNVQYYDSVPAKWLEPGIGGERVMAAGIYPAQPLMSRADWEVLRDYIIKNAPVATVGAPGMLPIEKGLPTFKARVIQPDAELQPLVTAVGIDTVSRSVLAAWFQQSFLEMGMDAKVRNRIDGLYGPIFLNHDAGGLTMAEIGSLKGSDHPKGSVRRVSGFAGLKSARSGIRFDSLMRPVMARWADLDADGDEDAVLAEFGYHLGELSWQENKGGGKEWVRHTLFPDDGTVSIHIADFTGDGLPDILSLKANADERVDLYVNKGRGEFEAKLLFRYNPTYGCAAMEVVDWNRDGKLDFLVANGDNGDYPPILKANHGVRLYLNQGGGAFKEEYYWPFNGAYGLRVRDFDLDGDPDLAAVSFYPDYRMRSEEAFVYFENLGGMKFKARTFPEVGLGRWMVMDAGDVDRDGDQDIVLGAFNVKSDDASDATYDQWMKDNVPVVVLENVTR